MFQRKNIIDVLRLYRPTSLQNFWGCPQTETGDRRFLKTFETAISPSQTRYSIVVLAYCCASLLLC